MRYHIRLFLNLLESWQNPWSLGKLILEHDIFAADWFKFNCSIFWCDQMFRISLRNDFIGSLSKQATWILMGERTRDNVLLTSNPLESWQNTRLLSKITFEYGIFADLLMFNQSIFLGVQLFRVRWRNGFATIILKVRRAFSIYLRSFWNISSGLRNLEITTATDMDKKHALAVVYLLFGVWNICSHQGG